MMKIFKKKDHNNNLNLKVCFEKSFFENIELMAISTHHLLDSATRLILSAINLVISPRSWAEISSVITGGYNVA